MDPAKPNPVDSNPYEPPSEDVPQPITVPARPGLPSYHWPSTIALFLILLLCAVPTYGFTFPLAIALLAGSFRTAWIVSACSRAGFTSAPYLGVWIVSTFLAFVFQFVSIFVFFIVCSTGMDLSPPSPAPTTEQFWLVLSSLAGMAVWVLLIWGSGWIAIMSRRIT